ncbi:hypothetical protein TWF191_000261 [Orbilia oligospora]|uniref:Uncharacterized protein n=1 Tax=Orbilia oligospora TaxID=2813651 RepID=A0A7C8V4Q4_ORBOL|nr:hypothetical protein TWF191_000261 [Orbilia oligospora]
MLYTLPRIILSALLLGSAVNGAAIPDPEAYNGSQLEERTACNADNLLRLIRGQENLAQGLEFCSSWLGKVHTTVTVHDNGSINFHFNPPRHRDSHDYKYRLLNHHGYKNGHVYLTQTVAPVTSSVVIPSVTETSFTITNTVAVTTTLTQTNSATTSKTTVSWVYITI